MNRLLQISKKMIFILVFSIMLISLQESVAAESTVTKMDVEAAVKTAIENSREIYNLGKSIEKLRKPYQGSYNPVVLNTDRYIILDRMNTLYKKLLSGKIMSLDEQGELMLIYSLYKDTSYSSGINLEQYIQSKDFPDAAVCAAIVKSSINKEMMLVTIENNVRQLYNSVGNTTELINILEDSYVLSYNIYQKALMDFKNGKISEQAKLLAEVNMKKQALELNKQKRNLNNLEIYLKQLVGINQNRKVDFVQKKANVAYKIRPLESYIDQAKLKRNEIIYLKMDLKAKEIELYRFNLFYSLDFKNDEMDLYKEDLELTIQELNNHIKEGESVISQKIIKDYNDLTSIQRDMENAKSNLNIVKVSYDSAKVSSRSGKISKEDLLSEKIKFDKANLEYVTMQRNFNLALYKIENSCDIGPAYN